MLNSYIFVIRKQNATRNCNELFEFLYFGFLDPPNERLSEPEWARESQNEPDWAREARVSEIESQRKPERARERARVSQSVYQINFQWSQNSSNQDFMQIEKNGLDWSKPQLSHSRASVLIFDTTISPDLTKQNQPQNPSQLLARCRRKLSWPTLSKNFSRRSGSIKKITLRFFITPESDQCLALSVAHWFTVETSSSLKGCP